MNLICQQYNEETKHFLLIQQSFIPHMHCMSGLKCQDEDNASGLKEVGSNPSPLPCSSCPYPIMPPTNRAGRGNTWENRDTQEWAPLSSL